MDIGRGSPMSWSACSDLQDGDILIYSDGGNVWNGKGLERFRELLGMLTMEKPILAFQQEFLEKEWTKRDVFDKICPNDVKKYAMTLQLWGGAFILMKSPIVDEFVETWNKLRRTDLHLFTDQRSSAPNLIGFREARHDQSIFSLLVKQRPHTEISWDEVEPLDGDWTGYDRFPIQAKRSKRMPIWKRGFSFFWRRCIGYYLIYFKHFYFSGRVAWSVTIAPTAALLPNLLGGKRNRLNPDVFPLSNNKMCA